MSITIKKTRHNMFVFFVISIVYVLYRNVIVSYVYDTYGYFLSMIVGSFLMPICTILAISITECTHVFSKKQKLYINPFKSEYILLNGNKEEKINLKAKDILWLFAYKYMRSVLIMLLTFITLELIVYSDLTDNVKGLIFTTEFVLCFYGVNGIKNLMEGVRKYLYCFGIKF